MGNDAFGKVLHVLKTTKMIIFRKENHQKKRAKMSGDHFAAYQYSARECWKREDGETIRHLFALNRVEGASKF